MVGCAVAFWLSRGGCQVTLIERDDIAAHASGRNAGNLNPLHETPAKLIPLALDCLRLHKETENELLRLGCPSYSCRPVRRMHVGYGEEDRTRLENIAALHMETKGFTARWFTGSDLFRLEPGLAPDTKIAVVTEGARALDSEAFTRSLAQGAEKLGAAIVRKAATGVTTSSTRVTAVMTSEGPIAVDDVVFATGPWTGELHAWLGIDLAIEPVKGELLVMRMRQGTPRHDITWESTTVYCRRRCEVWVGVTRENCGLDCTPSPAAMADLRDRAARIMPDMKEAALVDRLAALRPVSKSGQPVAERASDWANVYVANGGGSKGVLLSVGIARTILEHLVDRR